MEAGTIYFCVVFFSKFLASHDSVGCVSFSFCIYKFVNCKALSILRIRRERIKYICILHMDRIVADSVIFLCVTDRVQPSRLDQLISCVDAHLCTTRAPSRSVTAWPSRGCAVLRFLPPLQRARQQQL